MVNFILYEFYLKLKEDDTSIGKCQTRRKTDDIELVKVPATSTEIMRMLGWRTYKVGFFLLFSETNFVNKQNAPYTLSLRLRCDDLHAGAGWRGARRCFSNARTFGQAPPANRTNRGQRMRNEQQEAGTPPPGIRSLNVLQAGSREHGSLSGSSPKWMLLLENKGAGSF